MHSAPCRPCFSRLCGNKVALECLTMIGPNEVVNAVREQLGTRMAQGVSH